MGKINTLYRFTVDGKPEKLVRIELSVTEKPVTYRVIDGGYHKGEVIRKENVNRVVDGILILSDYDKKKAAYLLREYFQLKLYQEEDRYQRNTEFYNGKLEALDDLAYS